MAEQSETPLLDFQAPRNRVLYRQRGFWKTLVFLGGIAIPVLCFGSAWSDGSWLILNDWQSGLPEQYASLMLRWPAVLPFYPLLLYCVVCCALVIFGGQKMVDSIWVRGGIYTGVPLAVQYHCLVFPPEDWRALDILMPVFGLLVGMMLTVVGVFVASIFWRILKPLPIWLVRRLGLRGTAGLTVFVLVCYALAAACAEALLTPLFVIFIFAMFCGTTWATLTYGWLSLYVWKNNSLWRFRFGLLPILAGFSWCGAYLGACRGSVELALLEYAKLPAGNPNCYVGTAAARGHCRLVGSTSQMPGSGVQIRVNDQMRWLKAGELGLRAVLPRCHATGRSTYDWLGPQLASRISHPLLADLTYLMLKPVEWLTRLALTILQVDARFIRRLYPANRELGDVEDASVV